VLVLALAAGACGGSSPKGPPALVFVSTRDGDYALFGADRDGGHTRRLTKEKGDPATPEGLFFQAQPAWSPDGSKIAFTSRRDGTFHVYVMNADGSGMRKLTTSKQDDDRPAWSPDGTRVVFGREGALFVVPAGGGTARRVGRGLGNAADPAWSPDGTRIAYDYRNPGSAIREVYVMKADGTGIRRLTRLGNTSAVPAWSPDGARIAFQSNARGGHDEVYTIRADGTDLRQVTSTDADSITPAWSPEGDLTFARDGDLWVQHGSEASRLTSGGNNDSSPAWRPVPAK
jgi:Tol biopolymer transport system component